MARIRTIKPSFFKNEDLASLDMTARLLFIGLWTMADKEGRLEDRPKRINAEIFPYDDVDIELQIENLFRGGFIDRYEAAGVRVIVITNFSKHQRITGKEAQTISELPGKNQDKPKKQRGSTRETTGKQQGSAQDSPGEVPGAQERSIRKGYKGKEYRETEFFEPDGSEPSPKSQEESSFENFQSWIMENAPEVSRMKEPFTIAQFAELKQKIPPSEIRRLLLAMHNYAPLHKKNKSAYLTFLNWKRMDDERNPHTKPNESATKIAAEIEERRSREILDQAKR